MGSTPIRFRHRSDDMARDERHARARRRIPRRQRTAILVTAAILASIVVGYFAYRAQANLPGVQLPDQGNLHIASADSPHVQYNCECPELVVKLKAIVQRYDKHVILAPYPGMKPKIALTAWTRIDTLEAFDEARVTRFIETYRGIDHH